VRLIAPRVGWPNDRGWVRPIAFRLRCPAGRIPGRPTGIARASRPGPVKPQPATLASALFTAPAGGMCRVSHLASIGIQLSPLSPMYSLSGLISRLSACCSMMWAVQPAIRLTEKTGVNKSVGMPR
jgi:hypothetical protein